MDLQNSVISLNNLVPIIRTTADTYIQVINVLGFYYWALVDMVKSGQFRKLGKPEYYYYDDYFPYLSYYIPGK